MHYQLIVNDRIREFDAPSGTTLLVALRDDLALTGAKYGCGRGMCGACVVLVDGEPRPSCMLTTDEVAGARIVTVEGLARDGALHAVQQAFVEEDAMQCGYCTSGMILGAVGLLARDSHPTEDAIREAMATHLCRCGIYGRAIRAIRRAAR
jgi:aerobic-type carbon monoxide dehydrogenase small subunit (CoxS/CutS family)